MISDFFWHRNGSWLQFSQLSPLTLINPLLLSFIYNYGGSLGLTKFKVQKFGYKKVRSDHNASFRYSINVIIFSRQIIWSPDGKTEKGCENKNAMRNYNQKTKKHS